MEKCTQVSPSCPVSATVLGYYPNLGSGYFFAVAFGICLVATIGLGVWKRTWTYTAALAVGVFMESAGYIGRIILHANPWNSSAFQLEITTIIIAPTFICASIYLTLKHVALALDPSLSRIPPVWYPRLFLPGDLTCLIIQGIGGGLASAAGDGTNPGLERDGNRAIVAGIILQVIVLIGFGILAADYLLRARRGNYALWHEARFRLFLGAVVAAYWAMLIRCVYRIAEMVGGWGNSIMQDEPSFLVLDSSMVLISVSLLTIFHPGIFFPQMASRAGHKHHHGPASSESDTQIEAAIEPKSESSRS